MMRKKVLGWIGISLVVGDMMVLIIFSASFLDKVWLWFVANAMLTTAILIFARVIYNMLNPWPTFEKSATPEKQEQAILQAENQNPCTLFDISQGRKRKGGPKAPSDEEMLQKVLKWYAVRGKTTKEAFCSEEGMGTSTLRVWERKLEAKGKLPQED